MMKPTLLRSMSKSPKSHGGVGAIINYQFLVEYHLKNGLNEDIPGVVLMQWHGKGLADLGIDPNSLPDKETMTHLARGFAPDGITKLCHNAGIEPKWKLQLDPEGNPLLNKKGKQIGGWEGGHRVGVDLTFSADKSVSLLFAMGDDELRAAILQALHRSRDEAFAYVQEQVEGRTGQGGKNVVDASGLVATSTTHFVSRELDPGLHCHMLVFGVSQRMNEQDEDRKWGTHDAGAYYDHQFAAGAIFRSSMGREMQALGFAVEKRVDEKGHAYFGIAGIDEALCKHASKRRQDILKYMKDNPTANPTLASLATRRRKDEPPFEELTALWDKDIEIARKMGIPIPDIRELRKQENKMELRTDEEILRALHKSSAIFHRRDVIKELAGEGLYGRAELEAKADEFLQRAGVTQIQAQKMAKGDESDQPGRKFTEARYAADWMVELEMDTLRRGVARKSETHHHLGVEGVERVIAAYEKEKGFKLNPEQRDAVHWVTNETGGMAIVSGRAGTGKTTVSDVWVRAFKEQGHTVLGTSLGNQAAEKLAAEADIDTFSATKLLRRLKNGKIQLTDKHVLVFDEAGMAGTETMHKIFQYVDESKAKFIWQGDGLQLQAIEAGAPLRTMRAAIGDVELKEIRRQAPGTAEHEIANAFYGDGSQVRGGRNRAATLALGETVLNKLDAAGCIDRRDTEAESREALVDDYLINPASMHDKLIMAGTLGECAALNQAVREGRKARGELKQEWDMSNLSKDDVKGSIKLAAGDLITFTKADSKLGVVANDLGIIEGIREGQYAGLDLRVRLLSEVKKKHGQTVAWNTAGDGSISYRHLEHGYARTVHKNQGQGKPYVYHCMTSPGMVDQHMGLVAFTRVTAKNGYRCYGTFDGLNRIHERLGMERLNASAIEEGVVGPLKASAIEQRVQKQQVADKAVKPVVPAEVKTVPQRKTDVAERVSALNQALSQTRAFTAKLRGMFQRQTPVVQPEPPKPDDHTPRRGRGHGMSM